MVSPIQSNDKNISKQLIVIGNGFDLQCHMKTRYQDFFNYRFGALLQREINKYQKVPFDSRNDFFHKLANEFMLYFSNTVGPERIFSYVSFDKYDPSSEIKKEKLQIVAKTKSFMEDYSQQLKNQITNNIKDEKKQKEFLTKLNAISPTNYSKWDTIFLLANCFLSEDSIVQWNDVENIIFNVVSIILLDEKKVALNDLKFKTDSAKRYFIFGVKNCFKDDSKIVAISMLNELEKFEENFANYIETIKGENLGDYFKKSFELLNALMHIQKQNILDVLSFNYSLDKSFLDTFRKDFDNKYNNKKKLLVNSWSNIHGIAAYKNDAAKGWILSQSIKTVGKDIHLPAPIFGIDNHDILNPDKNGNMDFNDPRSIFTKSFRLLDNHVNNIRTNTFQDDVDVITFFGHSLNQADYSYFESIFDQYDIFHSKVKLEFYYYPENDNNKTTAKDNERITMKNVVRLLTSYGTTLKNEHGENIVNKLVLEQRLSIFTTPEY